jgi:hypothetical protein
MIILAGGDAKPSELPEAGAEFHPLEGPKGLALEVAGRPIIDVLIERLKESGCFGPIFIAGPARLYGAARSGCRVIDTDSTFGGNIQASVEAVMIECPGRPIAVTTCDILPEVDELHRLMEDYYHHAPLDFWFPAILAPEEEEKLGASAWKPKYRIAPLPGEPPRKLLPGHLIVVDPEAVRRPLIYRTFDLAYKSRNRPIRYRTGLIIRHILGGLVLQDLKLLFTLRLPTMTYTVISNGVRLALHLRQGVVTPEEMSERLRRIFVRYEHRRLYPERQGRLPLKHGLSLAKDIDTVEEAEEISQGLSPTHPS